MITIAKWDTEKIDIKNSITGLKLRFHYLKRFRENGSKACRNKLYETKCEATKDFFSKDVAAFFTPNKTSVVMVVNGKVERPFNAKDSDQMTPKDKFFLLYAIGFNNCLQFQQEIVANLELLRRKLELSKILTPEISDIIRDFSETLQTAFKRLTEEHQFFDSNYDGMVRGIGAKHDLSAWAIREVGKKNKIFYPRAQHINGVAFFSFMKATVDSFEKKLLEDYRILLLRNLMLRKLSMVMVMLRRLC